MIGENVKEEQKNPQHTPALKAKKEEFPFIDEVADSTLAAPVKTTEEQVLRREEKVPRKGEKGKWV